MIHHSTEDEVEILTDIKVSLDFAFHKTLRTIEGYSIAKKHREGR